MLKGKSKLINIHMYREIPWRRLWKRDMNAGSLFRRLAHEILVRKWGMWDKKGRKANNVYINRQNNVMNNYNSVALWTLSLQCKTNFRLVPLNLMKLSYLHISIAHFHPSLPEDCDPPPPPRPRPPCTKSPALLSSQADT